MKTYPTTVSRTLDPSGKSLVTIVGQHDRELSDADINLIQDLQDLKRQNLLEFATSGGTTYAPFQFNPFSSNTFFIPAFDVFFNGEVIHVGGNLSADKNLNRVVLPSPAFWTTGVAEEDARIYVVFLEIWYQALDSVTGVGYYVDPQTQTRYFFPFGGVNPDPSNATAIANDTTDPFLGLLTTQRAQIQWRIGVQRVSLGYDFSQHSFGLELDPLANTTFGQPQAIQAQAGAAIPIVGSTYQFVNMGAINGDTGVWRAGISPNTSSSLGSMDGFSYALPLAVVFQHNAGPFDINNNVFGCADPAVPGSGLLASRTSGRFDSKLADQIFPGDVVDTRSTVKLDGWDVDKLMREGFADLIMGSTRQAISRGISPGNKAEALGSTLDYTVAMSSTPVTNTDTVGKWLPLSVGGSEAPCGFANGFGSDQRTFRTAVLVTTSQKAIGVIGSPWVQNDAFTVSIPSSAGASIQSVSVTAFVTNSQTGVVTPAALLQGQVQITVGSTTVIVTFSDDLTGTGFDPGANPLSVVVAVTGAAGTGVDLRQIPLAVDGGFLQDQVAGKRLPVYGVSEYVVQADQLALGASRVLAINPEFSDILFGTRVWLAIPGTDPRLVQTVIGGSTITVLTLDRRNINGPLMGLYVARAWDFDTGTFYSITSRTLNGNNSIANIAGAVPTNSTLVVSVLAQDTCQVAFNAPVKAITTIEEIVLVGNRNSDSLFPMDPRVEVISVTYDSSTSTNTILMAANGCTLQGVAGDDVTKIIWVLDNTGNLNASPVTRMNISDGLMVATVVGADLTAAKFFFVAAINPALDKNSQLVLSVTYLPYQGEGVLQRDYEFVHAEDNALLTTNGTGAAPVAGLSDVFPYNRELPVATSVPSQLGWNDATLVNEPVASFFDSNFVAMRVNNVEHTFVVPLHTLDFIPPFNKDIRKTVRFITTGRRGFAKAIPHIGYGIAMPTPRTVLGQNLQATTAPITIYVNNASGNDANSGLDVLDAKLTITAAMAALPPVLRHPCVITLMDTGVAYNMATLKNTLEVIALGDGDIRMAKQYALANLSRVIQDTGRLVISRQTGATNVVVIDATGYTGFGDGPTSAFYIDTSRVILNGLKFVGFVNPANTAYNSDIDFVDCEWENNVQAGQYVGCEVVVIDRGKTTLPTSGVGHVCTQSNLTSSAHALVIAGINTGSFYVGTRNSTLNLQKHGIGTLEEAGFPNSPPFPPTAEVSLNSSISVTGDFQTVGTATLSANSTLSRTVVVDPFIGGVTADSSSNIVTQLG